MEWIVYIVLGAFAGFGAFTAGFLLGYNGRPRVGGVIDLTGMRRKR